LAGGVLFVTLATAQEKQTAGPSSKVKAAPQENKKTGLLSATRVSTDAATRSAAKKVIEQAGTDKTSKEPEGSDVVEFRPAGPESMTTSTSVASQKPPEKGPLKDFHGTVYGATDPGIPRTNAEGAAVGASSKSGKSAVFVRTDRTGTSPAR
jgi:hypothetical protein